MDEPGGLQLVVSCVSLVIALVIAVVVARDANRRGMNGLLWGIGVFLICIVFLPLYLILRKPLLAPGGGAVAPRPGYALGDRAPSGFCHKCGAPLQPDARFCGNCGAGRE